MPELSDASPILLISGTNRPGSYCLRVARRLERFYRDADVPVSLFSLLDLPPSIFDPASYATKPPEVKAVQQRVLDAAALHLVVPEYNGGFPGVLKLFIDHLRFPESFEHKPVAFTGEANGMWGALRPVEQITQIFAYRNAYIFPERVFIPRVQSVVGEDGAFKDADLEARLRSQAVNFGSFARKL